VALVQRLLSFTFQLGEGQFGNSGFDTVTIEGLRASCRIVKAGGPSMSAAECDIYGMTLDQMNKLSTLGMVVTLTRKNIIEIDAGDIESGMSTVFRGTIFGAWADFTGAPDVVFHVEACVGGIEALVPVAPTSFKGGADVATIMSGLATQMGLSFENNGVKVQLANPYYPGTARTQAQAVAEHAGVEWIIDNGTLAIWYPGQARGGVAPLLSPSTGMVGYPAYTSQGIVVRSIYNPSIGFGHKIEVQSDLQDACGEWVVFSLDHDLDAMMPHGKWFTTVQCARVGVAPVATGR
jgi:hypothetical protein